MLPFFVSYEIPMIRKTLRKDRAAAEGKFSLKQPAADGESCKQK